ncbi:hypothetical protein PPERSA_00210 [Pseudocohnilembus persalinus]|uniref:Uncharacterized protein n=1 Tax=Pseudocohnilembus persalinus TaxID=266149 RepID=A0A0V0QQ94_PSEPJ|nr:hypothetical protein PPERSA_00210 [Pseudocohnilembus persalinus]|eukprot:KRX04441.1 hypothetical protein PPERSA_00210 [Pseudocohnilembus persalinus]
MEKYREEVNEFVKDFYFNQYCMVGAKDQNENQYIGIKEAEKKIIYFNIFRCDVRRNEIQEVKDDIFQVLNDFFFYIKEKLKNYKVQKPIIFSMKEIFEKKQKNYSKQRLIVFDPITNKNISSKKVQDDYKYVETIYQEFDNAYENLQQPSTFENLFKEYICS